MACLGGPILDLNNSIGAKPPKRTGRSLAGRAGEPIGAILAQIELGDTTN